MAVFYQDPQALLDYTFDWTAWLNADTISTSAWATSSDLTIDHTTSTPTSATVWLKNGTAGITYKVRNTITTVNGRTEQRTFDLLVRDH